MAELLTFRLLVFRDVPLLCADVEVVLDADLGERGAIAAFLEDDCRGLLIAVRGGCLCLSSLLWFDSVLLRTWEPELETVLDFGKGVLSSAMPFGLPSFPISEQVAVLLPVDPEVSLFCLTVEGEVTVVGAEGLLGDAPAVGFRALCCFVIPRLASICPARFSTSASLLNAGLLELRVVLLIIISRRSPST